jgi:hypothetical protein
LQHHRSFGWQVHQTQELATGADALATEQRVLNWMRDEKGWPPALTEGSGWSETVSDDYVTAEAIWREVLDACREVERVSYSYDPNDPF